MDIRRRNSSRIRGNRTPSAMVKVAWAIRAFHPFLPPNKCNNINKIQPKKQKSNNSSLSSVKTCRPTPTPHSDNNSTRSCPFASSSSDRVPIAPPKKNTPSIRYCFSWIPTSLPIEPEATSSCSWRGILPFTPCRCSSRCSSRRSMPCRVSNSCRCSSRFRAVAYFLLMTCLLICRNNSSSSSSRMHDKSHKNLTGIHFGW
mmetsp:Transcript_20464/g.41100  ORF Transcript_20464/g.41100 Transcript_20464/m.41100 type:complete len:201 (+) Transcript_20464:1541-2143(+)